MNRPREKNPPAVIGWREVVGLPDLGVSHLRAKIDTGARTAALHAVDVQPLERDGMPWVSFRVPRQGHPNSTQYIAPVHDCRSIRNTSGVAEERWIIRTTLLLGRRRWRIQVSLANRESMGFELILGRTAIRGHRVLVDPNRSFLTGQPPAEGSCATALSDASGVIFLKEHPS
jgi:hypothetical protein